MIINWARLQGSHQSKEFLHRDAMTTNNNNKLGQAARQSPEQRIPTQGCNDHHI